MCKKFGMKEREDDCSKEVYQLDHLVYNGVERQL